MRILSWNWQILFFLHLPNINGHGDYQFKNQDYSIPGFAEDVMDYMDEKEISSVSVFGYNMGGYVALYLAKHYPTRVNNLITSATKFEWD